MSFDLQEQSGFNVDAGMVSMLHDYLWDAEETGGYYEGLHKVVSVLPGIGMLANGMAQNYHNVVPHLPRVDEGGLTRFQSPGAGAITHYHNYTFWTRKPLYEGDELFVNYGEGWFQERSEHLQGPPLQSSSSSSNFPSRDPDWLRRHGRCLDNMKPGPSRIKHAGRGAFATRFLEEGSIVAPVPLLPLQRDTLKMMLTTTTMKQTSEPESHQQQQLLLNYCFGHNKSSILLFSYGPMVK